LIISISVLECKHGSAHEHTTLPRNAPLQNLAVVAAVLCVVEIVDAEDFATDVGLDWPRRFCG
jgi:hypothetical protein